MDEHNQLQEWELLSSTSGDDSKSAHGLDEDDALREVIDSDYFATNAAGELQLHHHHHHAPAAAVSVDEGSQESSGAAGIDSDNPDSDSGSAGRLALGAEEGSFHELVDRREGQSDELGQVSLGESVETVRGSDCSGNEMDAGDGTVPEGGGKKREAAAWWKVPFEILRLYVSRARPVWSIPVAAAIIGFVMLGRRLYRMRRKGRRVPLRIAVDDKMNEFDDQEDHLTPAAIRASQYSTHAGRLNQALSAVKHVPIIRTSLAAGSVMQWPTASLR